VLLCESTSPARECKVCRKSWYLCKIHPTIVIGGHYPIRRGKGECECSDGRCEKFNLSTTNEFP
jgi:hypothetical protein